MSTQACIPQWQNVNLPVQAGKNATLRVWLMDSFGNNVSRHTFSREDPAIFAVHVMEVGSFGNTSTIKSFELVSHLVSGEPGLPRKEYLLCVLRIPTNNRHTHKQQKSS